MVWYARCVVHVYYLQPRPFVRTIEIDKSSAKGKSTAHIQRLNLVKPYSLSLFIFFFVSCSLSLTNTRHSPISRVEFIEWIAQNCFILVRRFHFRFLSLTLSLFLSLSSNAHPHSFYQSPMDYCASWQPIHVTYARCFKTLHVYRFAMAHTHSVAQRIYRILIWIQRFFELYNI